MDQIKNCELKFVVISEISKNPLTKKFFSDIINMFGHPKQYTRITVQGGVYMCGHFAPIWAVIIVEFILAFLLENIMGSPCSFKLACKVFDPRKDHPMLFESAIICATVGLMCPAMSLIAAFLYYPYYAGFNILTLIANWIKLVCYNFPFTFFSQLFFIQPLVRTVFKFLFRKDIAARSVQQQDV